MTAPDWDSIPLVTGATGDKHGDMHGRTLGVHLNALDYGAEGDGTTDDTARLQAFLDDAAAAGEGHSFIPPGNYYITSTLTLNGSEAIHLSGPSGSNPDVPWPRSGVRIFGNIAGPLLQRSDSTPEKAITIQDIGFFNNNNAGTCVRLDGTGAPGGFYRCNFWGHKGVVYDSETRMVPLISCYFRTAGTTYAGSMAIDAPSSGHLSVYCPDINGFEKGINIAGDSIDITGGRIEVCGTGIFWGVSGVFGAGYISGTYFEACDTGINLNQSKGTVVAGCKMNGTAGSPSSGSLYGLVANQCESTTIAGVTEAGSHATNFVKVETHAGRANLVFIGVRSSTAWSLADHRDITIIECSPENDIIHAPVIATASLPAAATAEDGRMIIEDGGAGDRNLIIYGGGERFRIDGGAAF